MSKNSLAILTNTLQNMSIADRELFEERAGILQSDGMSKEMAEAEAMRLMPGMIEALKIGGKDER